MILLTLPWSVCAQSDYAPPVKHPMHLSGTFGELRSGHFHTGIDIKAHQGRGRDPILAVQDGIVSRVIVSSRGYGNALYLQHPDGLTSVYGHLDHFNPELQILVQKEQAKAETFEVDLDLTELPFRVEQGDILGKMGNSGFSFGTHLHFELRKTSSNTPINPLPFWSIPDGQQPLIKEVIAYHLDHRGRPTEKTTLSAEQDTLALDAWRIGIAVDAVDLFNRGRNKNGVHSLNIFANDSLIFRLEFDSLALDHVDYRAHVQQERSSSTEIRRLHRCFVYGHHWLKHGQFAQDEGVIPLYLDRATKVTVQVEDMHANQSRQSFHLRRTDSIKSTAHLTRDRWLRAHTTDTIRRGSVQLIFDSLALFHDINLTVNLDTAGPCWQSVFLKSENPFLRRGAELQISLEPSDSHLVLTQWPVHRQIRYHPSNRVGNDIKAQIVELTDYCLVRDTLLPEIRYLRSRRGSNHTDYEFNLSDNIENIPWGIRCELNGSWILHSFDAKSNRLACRIPHESRPEKRQLKIEVTDAVGHQKTMTMSIE